jgi:3-dehydroquinate dehydratase II
MIIAVIHGPNLNLLGRRNHGFYGAMTLDEINELLEKEAAALGLQLEIVQSNSEAEIVGSIQKHGNSAQGIIINPAGFGYSSIAIRDAITESAAPVIEVHLSNIHAREEFRRHTMTSEVCIGQITGLKENSYILGLRALKLLLAKQSE